MTYISTKTYGHEVGLSCCFRQWKAKHSHCQKLHGYALAIRLEFESDILDDRNWVVDFGGLKDLKTTLQNYFDHKTLIAQDDPELLWFQEAAKRGILDLVEVPAVGCEKFAELVYNLTCDWLKTNNLLCKLASVEVKEHGANSAIYKP